MSAAATFATIGSTSIGSAGSTSGTAGVERVLFPELVASDVVLTNSRYIFDQALAEYTIGLMLALCKDLYTTSSSHQIEHRWVQRETETLSGKTVVMVGVGPIARRTAQIARATRHVGARYRPDGARRRPRLRRHRRARRAPGFLRGRGLRGHGAPEHAADRRDGRTRPPSTRSSPRPALSTSAGDRRSTRTPSARRCTRGALAGQPSTSMRPEPLLADSPLWDVPNLIVSPHMSGDHTGWQRDSSTCSYAISSGSSAAKRSSTSSTRALATRRRNVRDRSTSRVRRRDFGMVESPWTALKTTRPTSSLTVAGHRPCGLDGRAARPSGQRGARSPSRSSSSIPASRCRSTATRTNRSGWSCAESSPSRSAASPRLRKTGDMWVIPARVPHAVDRAGDAGVHARGEHSRHLETTGPSRPRTQEPSARSLAAALAPDRRPGFSPRRVLGREAGGRACPPASCPRA